MSDSTRRVATDLVGTFTDVVAIESLPNGLKITTANTDTTPPDFEIGVLNVLEKGGITSSGAGYGDPKKRDPEAVRLDIKNGLITAERAKSVHGQ